MQAAEVPGLRSVIHPVNNAPWPTRSGDGWRSEKDRLRVLPASKQAALERATRLRAGPAPGIAAACSHPKNARQFERSYTWALENRSNYLRELKVQSDEYQRNRQLKIEEAREHTVDATLRSIGSADEGEGSRAAESHLSEDEDRDVAFELFKQEFQPIVHGVWSKNKPSVRRAGGIEAVLQQVWERLPPKKSAGYLVRAAKQRMRDQDIHQALQQDQPSPLPVGSSASLEVTANWMGRQSCDESSRDRQRALEKTGPVAERPVSTGTQGSPRAAAQQQATVGLQRPSTVPAVSTGGLWDVSTSTIGDETGSLGGFVSETQSRLFSETREAPRLLRHCQNASVRAAGHLQGAQRRAAAGIITDTGTASKPAQGQKGKDDKHTNEEKRAVPAAAVVSATTQREESVRYWRDKEREARRGRAAVCSPQQAATVRAAIIDARDRLMKRPASAPGPTRSAASAGFYTVPDGLGAEDKQAAQQHEPEGSFESVSVQDVAGGSLRPSLEMSVAGPYARRELRRSSVEFCGPSPTPDVSDATGEPEAPGTEGEPEPDGAASTGSSPDCEPCEPAVTFAGGDGDDEQSRTHSTRSSESSDSESSAAGLSRSALDIARNFALLETPLVVRYHGKKLPRPATAAGVGALRRQRTHRSRALAASARVANAKRLLRSI